MLSSIRRLILLVSILAIGFGAGCRRAPVLKPSRPAQKQITVTLAAVGDVLLARGVGKYINKHGADYPFDKIRGTISAADIAIFNLECPLSKRGTPHRRVFLFRADPALAATIRKAGFDVAVLANNHTLDYGRTAMVDTIDAVKKAGIVPVGAGKDQEEALSLQVITARKLKVGFIAYTDLPGFGVVRLSDKPTVAGVNVDDLPKQIEKAKAGCDVLVVSFHWGIEYMRHPTERQEMIAHLCVDNGADAVLGHHPHVLQTVETYKGKPIIYSAGGFVWDCKVPNTDKSAIYLIELGKNSARLKETIPVIIKKCQPYITSSGGTLSASSNVR